VWFCDGRVSASPPTKSVRVSWAPGSSNRAASGRLGVCENDRVEITGVTNEQDAALKTGYPVWAWHQNVLTSYDWLEATVTKEPDMTLQYVVVDVWIPDPPPGSRIT
jgi:hypothetical protein